MKKLIVLLMIICLITCGCSKEETPKSNPVTETPTQEIMTTPEPTPTDEPTLLTTCAVCGKLDECQEIVRTRYSTEFKRDIDKVFYLCNKCYEDAIQDEKDLTTYKNLESMLSIVIATDDRFSEVSGTITIGLNKVTSPELKDLLSVLEEKFDDFNSLKTNNIYTIELLEGLILTKEKPKSILDTLD